MTLNEILDNQATRIEYCKKDKYMFFLYYFTDYFTYPSPAFHKEWAKDFWFNEFKYYINLGFRESAKTTYTKINICHEICYSLRNFILWISYDQKKAEASLFDVAVELQENAKIKRDFGLLFRADKKDKNKIEKKSIKEFVTTNNIKCLSFGTKGSLRGVVFGKYRPDLLVFDDIENNETKLSTVKTRGIINFIEETIPGLANHANVIVNCNYISEFGVVRFLLDKIDEKGSVWRKSWIDVETNGIPAWPEKYVMTNALALKANSKIADKRKYKVSLEQKKIDLTERVYNQEMMNRPIVKGERWFNPDIIDNRINVVKNQKDPKKINEWKRWGEYNALNAYAVGADVAQGVRADSAVIQIYDFTNDRQVGEFVSDEVDPRALGKEMVQTGMEYGNCILCPENNSIGGETIREIQSLRYENLYAEVTRDKIKNTRTNRFGWTTSATSKTEALINLRELFETGQIEINSLQLLYEMRAFTRTNLKIDPIYDEEISNHFDRVMAFAIVLMMRPYAKKANALTSVNAQEDYYND